MEISHKIDSMSTFNFSSSGAVLLKIGERARARRVALNWSRKTLAARSGIPESTIKRFELSGNAGLAALIQLALTLDAIDEFEQLFPAKPFISIAEVLAPMRKRGRQ